jgi:hypothetical protein
MPSARETPVNLHALRCCSPVPIGLQSLGWLSTRTLSVVGVIGSHVAIVVVILNLDVCLSLPYTTTLLSISISRFRCAAKKNRSYPAYKTPALRSSGFYSRPHS